MGGGSQNGNFLVIYFLNDPFCFGQEYLNCTPRTIHFKEVLVALIHLVAVVLFMSGRES